MEMKINYELVKELREKKLWTQEKLAEKACVHPRTIQRIEKDGIASMHTVALISQALGVESTSLEFSVIRNRVIPSGSSLVNVFTVIVLAILALAIVGSIQEFFLFPAQLMGFRWLFISITAFAVGLGIVLLAPVLGIRASIIAATLLVLLPILDLSANGSLSLIISYVMNVLFAEIVPLFVGVVVAKLLYQRNFFSSTRV
ncbi:MAG: hypothetical protein COA96_13780 [SAR86 cluster bacterium]|uniref:HTH cro/C1-type domain-containing protein n=1 Tax=SAR86 cluster bacterium TaxID=2030880 RepID=A0A2A5ATJ6_9GAMM|nr:MAG: hypothetical protein COA96_13780 [SAR86 cluster bacterium]